MGARTAVSGPKAVTAVPRPPIRSFSKTTYPDNVTATVYVDTAAWNQNSWETTMGR